MPYILCFCATFKFKKNFFSNIMYVLCVDNRHDKNWWINNSDRCICQTRIDRVLKFISVISQFIVYNCTYAFWNTALEKRIRHVKKQIERNRRCSGKKRVHETKVSCKWIRYILKNGLKLKQLENLSDVKKKLTTVPSAMELFYCRKW